MMHEVLLKYYTSGSFNIEDRALSDCELNYIRDWQRNEILFEYFNTLKEGFTCTLIQSKIVLNGRIKLDG